MSLQKVSLSNSVNFKGSQTNSKDNTTQPQNNIKNGKKKLVLALVAIGAGQLQALQYIKAEEKN